MELSSVFIIIFSLVVVYILYKYWVRDKKSPAGNQQSNLNRGPQVEVESITKSLLPNERGESNTEEYTEYDDGEVVVDNTKYQSTFHRLSNNVKLNFKWANKAGFESIKKVTLDWNIKRGDGEYVTLLTHAYEVPTQTGVDLPEELKNFTEHEVILSNNDFQNKEDKHDLRGIHQLVLKAYSKDTSVVHTLYTSPTPDADDGCKICKVTEDDLNLTMALVEAKNFVFTAQSSGFVKDTDVVEHPMYILNPKTFAPLNHMPFTNGGTHDYTVGLETELEPTNTTNVIYIKAKTTKTSNKDEFKYLYWNGTTKKLSWESGTSKRTKFYIEEFVDDISSNATTKRTIFSLASDTTKVLGYDKTNKKVTLINYFDIQADMNTLEAALWIIKYRNNDDRKPVFKIVCGRFDDHNIDEAGMLYLYMTKGSPSSQHSTTVSKCTGENVCISILSNKNTEKTANGTYVTTEYPGYQMYYMDINNTSLSNIQTKNPGENDKDRYLYHDINPELETGQTGWTHLHHDAGMVVKSSAHKLKCYENYFRVNKHTWKLKPAEISGLTQHCENYNGDCHDNSTKVHVCRYGALRTGVIPFNKVWNMGPYGKSANNGSAPPIFRLINKKIDDNLMVTFKVGWYDSSGAFKGFDDSINPLKNSNLIQFTAGDDRAGLWDNTDNTINPGILRFERGGGITVVTQWPAVASDIEVVGEGYTGIKFYKGNGGEKIDANSGLTSNEEFFKISQF